jgi:hypothetical protein
MFDYFIDVKILIVSFIFLVGVSCKKSTNTLPNNPISVPIPENVFIPANNFKAYGRYSGAYIASGIKNTFIIEIRRQGSKAYFHRSTTTWEATCSYIVNDGQEINNIPFESPLTGQVFKFSVKSDGTEPSIIPVPTSHSYRILAATICKDFTTGLPTHFLGDLMINRPSGVSTTPMIFSLDVNQNATGWNNSADQFLPMNPVRNGSGYEWCMAYGNRPICSMLSINGNIASGIFVGYGYYYRLEKQ